MNGSKLQNARGFHNLIISSPCITRLYILNSPVFTQKIKGAPHTNKQKKWNNYILQYQSGVSSISSNEGSPNNASVHSSMVFVKFVSQLQPSLLYSALWCWGWDSANYISFLQSGSFLAFTIGTLDGTGEQSDEVI